MKIVFFGSDDFAAVHLGKLLQTNHELLALVTGPDKPKGRGMKVFSSALKEMALEHKIPCLQPITLKDKNIVEQLRFFNADIFVVVAYGRLLSQEILDIPKLLCMNVHGSLLPKYRGAAPINWAILNGDCETGVTIQKMALQLDAGAIIAQERVSIDSNENASDLRQRMAQVGANLLVSILHQYPLGQFPLIPQDEALVSLAPKLTKEMGKIDWQKSARFIEAQVRGLQSWPGAYTFYNGKMLKIIQAQIIHETSHEYTVAQVTKIEKSGFYVQCGEDMLLVKQVQPEAGKIMPAASFIAGYKVVPGFALGI